MVFCLESLRQKLKCDLLLPINDNPPSQGLIDADRNNNSLHI